MYGDLESGLSSKNAFILGGGGAKGALQVGMLKSLYHRGIYPSLLVGVSTGALQSSVLAQGSDTEHYRRQVKLLEDIWRSIKGDEDIYTKPSWWRQLLNIGLKAGIYDSRPLWDLIYKHVDADRLYMSNRDLLVGVVNLQSGKYEHISTGDIEVFDGEDVRDYIYASTAMPAYFPPVKIGGSQYADGGVRSIAACDNLSIEEYDKVYLLLCSPREMPQESGFYRNTLDVALRSLSIIENEAYTDDITALQDKLGDKLVVIEPMFIDTGTLEFSPTKIARDINYGFTLTEKLLSF